MQWWVCDNVVRKESIVVRCQVAWGEFLLSASEASEETLSISPFRFFDSLTDGAASTESSEENIYFTTDLKK